MKTIELVTLMLLLALPLRAQEPAEEQAPVTTRITGTLLGADGQPMELAHVSLYPRGQPVTKTVEVRSDGSYVFETDSTGVFLVWFTGVDHLLQTTPLLLTGEGGQIRIDVRLGMHDFEEDFSGVAVIGDFNDFSFSSGTRKMEPREDGTYVLEIECDADTLAYQVINVARSRSMNGTQSDWFVYDGGGDYRSVIDVDDGVARIVFDPEKLMVLEVEPNVSYGDPNSIQARYADFAQQMTVRRDRFIEEYQEMREGATQDELATFSKEYDWSENDAALEAWLSETNDPNLRATLLLTYLLYSLRADSLYARMALAEIEPGSPKWAMAPQLLVRAVFAAGGLDANDGYVYAALREQDDERTRTSVLGSLLSAAHRDKREAEARILYAWLVSEYPETFEGRWARAEYDPNRAIRVGQPVPEFEITSLEDSTVIYSSENMKGQIYLIDFWASWCGPCIAELPYLHAAYEKYKDDGLTILSLSFDSAPDDVVEFRAKGEWTMLWLHAFVPEGFSSDLAERFQVLGIPKLILIGEDGTIIAEERDLRGQKLDETLAEVFGREPTPTQEQNR